jgi:hypothetical protein
MQEITIPVISRDQTPALTSADELIRGTANVTYIVDSSTAPVNVVKFPE